MRIVLLGALRGLRENRWKNDAEEGAQHLGWDVTHVNARGIPDREVVRLCRGADALVWMRTHGHDPTGDVAGMLRRVEDMGVATVGLHLDLYWGIPRREQQIGRHPWWTCQHIFTADGGDRGWKTRRVNHHWCPPPMGHRYFGRGRPTARFKGRAAFVGGFVPGIHGPHRAALLRWGRSRYGAGFRAYGRQDPVWGSDLNDLYASVDVALGDSAPAPCYWSDRVPCTLGRGGLLAYPRTAGLDGQGFTDEVMLLYDRGNFNQIGERLADMSAADRKTMTDNALTVVAERHMWRHRMADIQQAVTT